MQAVKGNKVYRIEETQKALYVDMGFDILDDSGNILEYAKGKTVSYGEYMKLKAENEALKAEIEALKKSVKKAPAKKA